MREEIDADLGLDPFEAMPVLGQDGRGRRGRPRAIVERLPPPKGEPDAPLQALLFDAQYDAYRGVVMFCRVKQGRLKPGMRIRLMHTDREYQVEEVGTLAQDREKQQGPRVAGSVGYVICGVKTISDINIGDTVTLAEHPAPEPIPGYREAKPVVFSSIYPVSSERLR